MPAAKRRRQTMDDHQPSMPSSRKRIKKSGSRVRMEDNNASPQTVKPEATVRDEPSDTKVETALVDHQVKMLECMSSDFQTLRKMLECKICYRMLYEPFTSACGHTSCYGCLTNWFRNKSTCPECREEVKVAPAPAFLIRELVHLFVQRADLMSDGDTIETHKKMQEEETEMVANDKANTDVNTGGLFQGLFRPKQLHLQPQYDAHDNVMRCPTCFWELEDFVCGQCGYDVRDDESDLDADLENEDSDGHAWDDRSWHAPQDHPGPHLDSVDDSVDAALRSVRDRRRVIEVALPGHRLGESSDLSDSGDDYDREQRSAYRELGDHASNQADLHQARWQAAREVFEFEAEDDGDEVDGSDDEEIDDYDIDTSMSGFIDDGVSDASSSDSENPPFSTTGVTTRIITDHRASESDTEDGPKTHGGATISISQGSGMDTSSNASSGSESDPVTARPRPVRRVRRRIASDSDDDDDDGRAHAGFSSLSESSEDSE